VGELDNFQTGPVVYNGTMYVTTLTSTIALDAATCRVKWRHAWQLRADSNLLCFVILSPSFSDLDRAPYEYRNLQVIRCTPGAEKLKCTVQSTLGRYRVQVQVTKGVRRRCVI